MNKFDSLIEKTVTILLRIIHKEKQEELVSSLVQFIKFGIVGLSNTILSYGINVLVLKLLQPYGFAWDYVAANIIAFILSVAWSFFWNNKYVFITHEGQKRNPWKTLLKTYLSYGFTGIILTNILSYLWNDVLGISKFVSPLINLIIKIPLNFIISKLWAFRTEPDTGK